jgi:hypothetical protein
MIVLLVHQILINQSCCKLFGFVEKNIGFYQNWMIIEIFSLNEDLIFIKDEDDDEDGKDKWIHKHWRKDNLLKRSSFS